MNALILAAGFGTRLGEFGVNTPKGLIRTASGRVILEILMNDLVKLPSIERICLVTNERFVEIYKKWLSKINLSERVEIFSNAVTEPEKRNGALKDLYLSLTQFNLENNDLLVCPSDTYYGFSLEKFIKYCKKEDTSFVTVVKQMEFLDEIKNRLGCAIVKKNRIVDFIEKPSVPPSLFGAVPFYYYPKSYLTLVGNYIGQGGNVDAPGSIIPWLIREGKKVFAFKTKGSWIDVGTIKDVRNLQKH